MTSRLEEKARAAGILLAGSVIAVPSERRPAFAERLIGTGHWVHADVIGGSYLGQAGVRDEEIGALAALAGTRLDVHLMVDDLAEAIDRIPVRVGRITLQCPRDGDLGDLVRQARAKAPAVWIALDSPAAATTARALGANADGIIAMLTPPGQPGHAADLARLDQVRAAIGPRTALGVDGGVNQALIEHLEAAGVAYAVAGRGLVGGLHASSPGTEVA